MTTVVGLAPGDRDRDRAALHLGAVLARSFHDDLVVASVVPTPWPPNPNRPGAEFLAYQEATAREALDGARRQLGADADADVLLHRASSVSSGLLEIAHERGASMMALGSAATGPFGRVSLGGVADRVVHGSGLSLALAPRGFTSGAADRLERLTVGFGRSDGDGELLAAAATAAAATGARLRVACFAVRPATAFGGSIEPSAEDLVVDEWVRRLHLDIDAAMTAAGLGSDATEVHTVVGQGSSWGQALEDVSWGRGDLLLVGSSGAPFSRFLLGSHAAKIVRSSSVPVLLVPRSAGPPGPGVAQ